MVWPPTARQKGSEASKVCMSKDFDTPTISPAAQILINVIRYEYFPNLSFNQCSSIQTMTRRRRVGPRAINFIESTPSRKSKSKQLRRLSQLKRCRKLRIRSTSSARNSYGYKETYLYNHTKVYRKFLLETYATILLLPTYALLH